MHTNHVWSAGSENPRGADVLPIHAPVVLGCWLLDCRVSWFVCVQCIVTFYHTTTHAIDDAHSSVVASSAAIACDASTTAFNATVVHASTGATWHAASVTTTAAAYEAATFAVTAASATTLPPYTAIIACTTLMATLMATVLSALTPASIAATKHPAAVAASGGTSS